MLASRCQRDVDIAGENAGREGSRLLTPRIIHFGLCPRNPDSHDSDIKGPIPGVIDRRRSHGGCAEGVISRGNYGGFWDLPAFEAAADRPISGGGVLVEAAVATSDPTSRSLA